MKGDLAKLSVPRTSIFYFFMAKNTPKGHFFYFFTFFTIPDSNSVYLGRSFCKPSIAIFGDLEINFKNCRADITKPQTNEEVLKILSEYPRRKRDFFHFTRFNLGQNPFWFRQNYNWEGRKDFVGMDFRRPVQPQHPALRAPVTPKPLFLKKTQHKTVWLGWQNYFFFKIEFQETMFKRVKMP